MRCRSSSFRSKASSKVAPSAMAYISLLWFCGSRSAKAAFCSLVMKLMLCMSESNLVRVLNIPSTTVEAMTATNNQPLDGTLSGNILPSSTVLALGLRLRTKTGRNMSTKTIVPASIRDANKPMSCIAVAFRKIRQRKAAMVVMFPISRGSIISLRFWRGDIPVLRPSMKCSG